MKKILILLIFSFNLQLNAQPIISDDGLPEHVIAGAVIGAGISYLVYKKTDNKLKAWFIGVASAAAIGYIKEVVDPKWFNGVRSKKDFGYTALGGVIGARVVIQLKRKKPRETTNIAAAFN